MNFPVGISDFSEIRSNGYYYIDKTGLIRELLKTPAAKVTLITRPRRFGKTLNMSMLAHFFDMRMDSRKLFEGLEISEYPALCEEWMNQRPVLFLTFKDVAGLDFASARGMLRNYMAQICNEHYYLAESGRVNENDRKVFCQLADTVDGRITDDQLKTSLALLMRLMQAHFGKRVVLLLDEYDVPLAKANSGGYYREMLEVIGTMLSTALKDSRSLRFAVVTGCLRIAKESIFTGTNNFTTDTISDSRYHEFFGFTQRETQRILEDAGGGRYLEKVRRWYDGYHFGGMDIYCPWDVLNYVQKGITEGTWEPENFWEHTSDNAIIGSFLKRRDFDVTEKFELLLDGGYVKENVSENLTYDLLASSEDNLWSFLYLTGYLTKVREEELLPGDVLEEKQTALRIPNAEVMDIFRKSVVKWFQEKAVLSDRSRLFGVIWQADGESLTEILSDLLFDTISFHDYAESFYHAFLTGLFSSAGYVVESNYENGLGRSDLVIKDRGNRRAAVIEAKIAVSEDGMEKACRDALEQIEEKQYARKIERSGFRTVLRFGIAFYRKKCLAVAEPPS